MNAACTSGLSTQEVPTEEGMNSLRILKWNSQRLWIIYPEMIVFPILWFLSQARAAPSLTAEQMDMGVVSAVKPVPTSHLSFNLLLPRRRRWMWKNSPFLQS